MTVDVAEQPAPGEVARPGARRRFGRRWLVPVGVLEIAIAVAALGLVDTCPNGQQEAWYYPEDFEYGPGQVELLA